MLRHSILNLQDGGRRCSKAVILNDFQALLLNLKAKLHQMTIILKSCTHERLFKVKYF